MQRLSVIISMSMILVMMFFSFTLANNSFTVLSHHKISKSNFSLPDQIDFNFGSALAFLGDLDGIGPDYLAVGAQHGDGGGTDQGVVWILTLDSTGNPTSYHEISSVVGNGNLPLQYNDGFGASIALLGDVNGDSIDDIAVGANGDGENEGAVWILFLNGDGTVQSYSEIDAGDLPLSHGDEFGSSVISLGDLDGAGSSVQAIAVGSKLDDSGGNNRGEVYIIFLNSSGGVLSYYEISDESGDLPIGALQDDDRFGKDLAVLGDLGGDGTPELVVGACGDDGTGTSDRGAFWVLSIDSTGHVSSSQEIGDMQGGFCGDLDDNDCFGFGLSAVGDLDGDGITDLLVGATGDDDDDDGNPNDQGAVWILFLNTDGTVKSFQKISETVGGLRGELDAQDYFGYSVTCLGDLNNDGITDLAVGAADDDDGGTTDVGAVWILSLTPTPIEVYDWQQAVHLEFRVTNPDSLAPINNFHIRNPRIVFADCSPPDSSIYIKCAGIVDYSPIQFPATPPDRWSRIVAGEEAWWFFPSVAPELAAPDMDIVFSVPPGVDPDSLGTNDVWYEVDYFLSSGPDTLLYGVCRFRCDSTETGIGDGGGTSPIRVRKYQILEQNYPNPFNPVTTIRYTVPQRSKVHLSIYNITGQLVRVLVLETQDAGVHEIQWDGINSHGQTVASGVYMYQITIDGMHEARKMILIK